MVAAIRREDVPMQIWIHRAELHAGPSNEGILVSEGVGYFPCATLTVSFEVEFSLFRPRDALRCSSSKNAALCFAPDADESLTVQQTLAIALDKIQTDLTVCLYNHLTAEHANGCPSFIARLRMTPWTSMAP
jgi:hypothetical protein